MSRASIVLLTIVLLIVGGIVFLAGKNVEVAPAKVVKPVMLNEAASQ